MPQGDPGGHMESTGGYGGNFGGMGGRAGDVSGAEHGGLGFGGMSPGGYNSTTYSRNLAGLPGTPGFGARVEANRANYNRQQHIAQVKAQLEKYPNNISLQRRLTQLRTPQRPPTGDEVLPNEGILPAEERVIATEPFSVKQFSDRISPEDPLGGAVDAEAQWGNYQGWDGMLPGGSFGYDADNNTFGGRRGNFHGGGGRNIAGRQFGGYVSPKQTYTVGENGPETFVPNQPGTIVPNPKDQAVMNQQPLGGMDPQMMQQLFQMMRQRQGGFQGGQPPAGPQPAPPAVRGGAGGWQQGMTPPATMPPAPARPPMGGGYGQPPQPVAQPKGGTGFGLSGLGQPGVLQQLRQRMGTGGY